jgi:hypothetical protein
MPDVATDPDHVQRDQPDQPDQPEQPERSEHSKQCEPPQREQSEQSEPPQREQSEQSEQSEPPQRDQSDMAALIERSEQSDMTALIERARADARRKRAEAGLPPLAPDELEQPRPVKGRRLGKRSKNYGQWMRAGSK